MPDLSLRRGVSRFKNNTKLRPMVKSISACYKYLFAFAAACMAVMPASALTLAIDSASGAPSDTVTLNVRVYGFTDLLGAQGTIQFDTTAVSLVLPIIVPVPAVLQGLLPSNFGTNNPLYPGTITFLWDDGTLAGVSVPDGSVIFSMKFILIGSSGTQSPVSFSNVPTPLEFIDNSFNPIAADALIPGLIEISSGCTTPADCDDADACTIDTCDNGQCQNTAIPCDDGDGCTADSCDAGLCVYTPVNCDDGNDCTTDFCIGGACQSTAMNCDDGDPCTNDTCIGGGCDYSSVICDDGDLCTSDSCDPASGCTFDPVVCNDGDNCTTDACVSGICNYAPAACNDTDLCTIDTCVAGSCLNIPISCNDNNACTVDQCVAGGCTNTPAFCNDGNACTTDACDPLTGCTTAPISCDDGDSCTIDGCDVAAGCFNLFDTLLCGIDPCDTLICNDNNACTTDACVGSGCAYTPIICDDGDACTTDGCDPLTGCATTPIPCDDGNACTTDGCDPLTGCTAIPITCDDGNACTTDGCNPLTGCATTPITCDDGDTCTIDGCDAASGCFYIFDSLACGIDPCDTLVCNDNDACTTDDCAGGVCENTAMNCDDLNQCTVDACVNGLCTYNDTCSGLRLAMDRVNGPQGAKVILPVRVYDFIDIIGLQGTIQFDPSVAAFDSLILPFPEALPSLNPASFGTNNAASGIITFLWDDATLGGVSLTDATVIFSFRFNLVGNPGESTVTSFVNQPTPVELTDATFNTVTASLTSGLIEIDSAGCNPPCDDFDLCTTNDCVNSTCVYTPINCDDSNLCTNDGCDNGNCFHNPVTCDDGDLCTNDACQAGNCFNTPVTCDDGNPCTDDSCFAGNCVFTPIIPCFDPCDTIVCVDDLNPCTIDTCINGVCNTPINCNDGNDCTTDFCDLGACHNNPVTCDDGDACTTDGCIGGGCEYIGVNCDDGDSCTFDFCDLGICQHTPNTNCGTCQGVNCNDGNLCTTDTCVNGQCFNTPINCNDQDACTIDECIGGVCENTAINCDDLNQCTVDACASGSCVYNDTCSGLRLAMDRVNGPQGTDVVLPVRVYDFIDIIGLQGTIQFDPSVASFVQMELPSPAELPGLTPASFGTNNAASGIITFLWDDATLGGVSLTDATVIFSIRFNLVGNPGESTVTSFVNQPTPVEVTDATFNTVTASLTSGLIEIDGGCVPPCNDGDPCTTDDCVNSSCVYTPINCDDGNLCTNDGCDNGNCFHNPVTCDDGDLCTNDACQAGNCFNTPVTCDDGNPCTDDSCFAGNCVFTPIIPCFDPCDTIVCVDDFNPCTIDSCINGVCNTPINCDDGDGCTNDVCDLGICYNYPISCDDGDACTTDSCVGGVCKHFPVSCDDGDRCTADGCVGGVCEFTAINCNDGNPCTIDFCSNGQCVYNDTCPQAFRLQMDTLNGATTSDVSMPVSAYGFDSIIAIQGTIQFDPAVVSFVQMEIPSPSLLPNLTIANFGTTQASSGIITFSWDDATLAGVTLPNASLIFSIRFNLIGNSGEQTATSFTGTPTLLEFIDVNFNPVTAILNNGLIIITGGPVNTITTGTITPTTFCAGDALTVNFTKTGTFNPGNVFTAQLSDENGSFSNPVNIGSITDTAAAPISATIPLGAVSGTNYRIRVVSSSPAVTGFDNGTGLTINASGAAQVTIAASHTISCLGDNITFFATPFNGGSNPTYDWFVNGSSQQVNAPIFNITTLNDGDIVYAVMTSNSACVSQPTDTSDSISIAIADTLIPDASITSNALDICDGDNVTFTALPVNGGANPTYEWFRNGASTGVNSETFDIATLNNADSVHVVMTSSLSCAVPTTATSGSIRITVNPLVNVSVTIAASDTNICSGQNVTFTATSIGGGANPTYRWIVSGVVQGLNSDTFSSTTLNNGDVVHVEMTSSESCANPRTAISNSETMFVAQSDTPTAIISPNSNQTCIGETITLTASITNGGPNPIFIWRINGVDSITTSSVFTYQPSNGDDASLILISSLPCANLDTVTSNVLVIRVDSALTPAVSITATPASVCAGETITFTALPANEGASPSYQWQVNGVDVGTDTNTYSSSSLDDNDVVSVTLTSSLSCANPNTATDDFTVNIAPSAVPSVLIAASPSNNICSGTIVTFTATPANGGATPSYQWQVNGVNAGTNSDTFSSASLRDNDIVTVVMTSSSSCANPKTVTSNPIRMTVSPSLTAGVSITTGSTTACVGETVTFTATPVNGGLSPSYQWLVNGGSAGTNSSVFSSGTLSNGDMVSVVMTSSEICVGSVPVSSNTITMSVVTNITPQVTISVNANNVCQGSTVMFTAAPINGGVSPTYQWEVNGTAVAGSSNVLLTTISNGDIVNVRMTSSYSCASPDTVPSNSISMTVGPSQPVSFTGLGIEYCVDVSAQSLIGDTLIGTFSGPGVSGATFVPFHAGVGTHYISYSYQAAAGCTAIVTKGVVIHALPVVNFYNLDNSYCSLQQTDTLIGVPSGPGGTFSGTDITGNLFKVPNVTAGTSVSVTYTYVDSNNCKATVTKFTAINPVITPTLIGVGKQYCENSNVINLNASPSPGIFTVDGVADNTFNPAAAGLGTHALEYTYVDINNCPNKVAETLNVNPVPLVSLANVAPVCLNAAPVALQGTPSGGEFTSNDQTGDNVVNGDVFSPNNGSPGSTYTVTYTYTDVNQCTNFDTKDVNILTPPFVSILTDDDSVYSACLDSVLITVNVPGGTLYGAALNGFVFNPSLAGAGDHYLTYVLTNTSGCTGSDKMVIKVSKCITGIEELGVDVAVVVYPNPSEGIFIIENLADKGGDVMLEVFSIEGRRMLKQEISNFHKGSRERIDLSGYAEGMYLLKMNFGDAMLMKRVVVSR